MDEWPTDLIGMYCDVSFAKKQLIELLGVMNDSRGLFLNLGVFTFRGL